MSLLIWMRILAAGKSGSTKQAFLFVVVAQQTQWLCVGSKSGPSASVLKRMTGHRRARVSSARVLIL